MFKNVRHTSLAKHGPLDNGSLGTGSELSLKSFASSGSKGSKGSKKSQRIVDESTFIHVSSVKGSVRHQTHITEVTDRLKKAMANIDEVMVESDDKEFLDEFFVALKELESGKLKYQMREFVDRYRNIHSLYKDVNQEKNQVLEALTSWFLSEMKGEIGDHLRADESVSKLVTNTTLVFEKLLVLDKKIDSYESHGISFDHLNMERHDLQRRAVGVFTKLADARVKKMARDGFLYNETKPIDLVKDVAKGMRRKFENVEKDLTKLKDENFTLSAYEDVKKAVEDLKVKSDQMLYKMKGLYEQIEDFKKDVAMWKEENMTTVHERALLAKKVKKIKLDFRTALYELERYQAVTVPDYLAVENDAVSEEDQYSKDLREDIVNPDRPKRDIEKHMGQPKQDAIVLDKLLASAKEELVIMRNKHKKEIQELSEELINIRRAQNEQLEVVIQLKRQKAALLEQLQLRLLQGTLKRNPSDPGGFKRPSFLDKNLLVKGLDNKLSRRDTFSDAVAWPETVAPTSDQDKGKKKGKGKKEDAYMSQREKMDELKKNNDRLMKQLVGNNQLKKEYDYTKSRIDGLETQLRVRVAEVASMKDQVRALQNQLKACEKDLQASRNTSRRQSSIGGGSPGRGPSPGPSTSGAGGQGSVATKTLGFDKRRGSRNLY